MNTDSVLSTLLRYVNGQYKKDTNYDIALALLTHYSVIPEKTINELSELCFVSPASISRFVKLMLVIQNMLLIIFNLHMIILILSN